MNPLNSDLLFPGESELAARMRSLDWSKTSLGEVSGWSSSLKTAVSICLNSRFPMVIWWGKDLVLFYNDAWRPILGTKHPKALGRPGQEVWSEIWDIIGAQLNSVLETGQATWSDDTLLLVDRYGYIEEAYFTYSYSPIFLESGAVGGAFTAVTETTRRVVGERRLSTLRELAANSVEAKSVEEACRIVSATIASNSYDISFALLYLVEDKTQVELAEAVRLEAGTTICPELIDLTQDQDCWKIAQVIETGEAEIVELTLQFGQLPRGVWDEPSRSAITLPIAQAGQKQQRVGLLVLGISPRLEFDDEYRGFFDLVASNVATAIANAQAYEEERKRAEALAEIDRAKTVFFSNVSHEFRTPLTLMLSPLEELSNSLDERLQPEEREQLQMVQRNGLRLQKLVNTLLDFSRIEAGRVQASYEPTDLATFTAELASSFRSLIEQAGLRLTVDCSPLPESVYVDREMWEKIILNLLSNAFKFTFVGEILVRLQWQHDRVELTVQDSGIGIPASELPHLFERFHRVEGAKGRSIEGSGIGLSLVQELIKLHGGTIHVTSTEGAGTCFTVSIPTGTAHLPPDRISLPRTLASTALGANTYLEEALRWLLVGQQDSILSGDGGQNSVSFRNASFSAKILLADDNADMRDYVRRLLSQQYEVETVSDGLAALSAIRHAVPDLILTDVMMPNLNGFGVLQALRSDPATRDIPIILLSARAGEEARVEGLAAGADDYLIKPFSARELLARVEATLKLSQQRREATQQEQALRLEAETARQQVETILSSIRDGFYVLDRDWRFTYVNDRHCQIINMLRSEILGRSVWELFPEAIELDIYQHFHQAMRDQTPMQFENLYSPWNRWYEHRIYPSPNSLSVFVTEINDRKQAELERERLLTAEQQARAEAQAANRIKDEFLAVLSHELRSPLNPILGWAKLLKAGNLDAATTAQALSTIERNAKLQAELIEDLLDVSRILQGKLSLNVNPIDLATTVRSAMETVRLAAEAKSITIEADLEARVGRVSGDSTRLQQVVWNLLSNAVKFTPAGGRVAVRLEQVDNQAQITVRDNGKGIPANFLPHVFDYFRQEDGATTRQFGGLGLGLAIVRHLVELHGGTVQAESPGEGLGATFTVKLPLTRTQTRVRDDCSTAEPSPDLHGVNVLVVDDEADSREFVAFVLKQAGASVTVASTASEGFLALTQSPPDVLLSDIGMPDMDGYMLMRQVRTLPAEQGGQVEAIALTAYAGDFDQQQALTAGFQHHLSKPVEPDVLIRLLSRLLREF